MDKSEFKIDRNALSVTTLEGQDEEEKKYWKKKPPAERMKALEITRQIIYGYNPDATRLQRFFEVVERP